MPASIVIFDIGWIIFWFYWLISAFSSKKTTSKNRWKAIGIGVAVRFILFVFVVLAIKYSGTARSFFLIAPGGSFTPLLIIGFILWAGGIALAIWARVYLGKNWGMPMMLKQDPELVTTGPYRYIRHPIYTGVILAAFGSIFVSGTWWLLLFVAMGGYFLYSAIQEDRLMAQTFPNTYPAYKARTKMIIPFVL